MSKKRPTTQVPLKDAAEAWAHHRYLGELLIRAHGALLHGDKAEALKCIKLARRAQIGVGFFSNDDILVTGTAFRQSPEFATGYEDLTL